MTLQEIRDAVARGDRVEYRDPHFCVIDPRDGRDLLVWCALGGDTFPLERGPGVINGWECDYRIAAVR